LQAADSVFESNASPGVYFKAARITNGATAQYIQIWDAADEADITVNGVLKESVYMEANKSIELGPTEPEQYLNGVVIAGSSNASALSYTSGANLDFVVAEFAAA
jgi:glutaredoxin-related protein